MKKETRPNPLDFLGENRLCEPFCNLNKTKLMPVDITLVTLLGYHEMTKSLKKGKKKETEEKATWVKFLAPSTHTHTQVHTTQNTVLQHVCFDFFAKKKKRDKIKKRRKKKLSPLHTSSLTPSLGSKLRLCSLIFLFSSFLFFSSLISLLFPSSGVEREYFSLLFFPRSFCSLPSFPPPPLINEDNDTHMGS